MSVFSRKETKVFQNEGSLSSFVLGVVRDSISKNLLIATDMIWSFIAIKKRSLEFSWFSYKVSTLCLEKLSLFSLLSNVSMYSYSISFSY